MSAFPALKQSNGWSIWPHLCGADAPISARIEGQGRWREIVSEQLKGEEGLPQHSVALGSRFDVAVRSREDFVLRNTACIERTRG